MQGGDLTHASTIGINLPNPNWIRKEHGSKSVTLGNLMEAYEIAAAAGGLSDEFCRENGATVEHRQSFTRHYHEQLEGAELAVVGGVIEARPTGLRFYHELTNPAPPPIWVKVSVRRSIQFTM